MFISSMARKNHEKQRIRSKSAGSLRRSTDGGHAISNRNNEQEKQQHEVSSKPPESKVNKSNRIYINGLEKQLQKTREIKHLSNSAKTIRPNSKVKVVSNTSNVHESNWYSDAKNTDDGTFHGDTSSEFERNLRIVSGCLPAEEPFNGRTERPTQPSTSFIDTPKEAKWYLDPCHRRVPSNCNGSLSRSYLEFDDKIPPCDDIGDNIDNDYESELDLHYLEKSKLIEQEALARATCSSPYELELCRLRKEKLRLEESYLLKKKCEFELERTRGPKPKWYELKSPQFTIEMEKYDNLMNNRKYWNEIIDYRNGLVETSMQLPNLR